MNLFNKDLSKKPYHMYYGLKVCNGSGIWPDLMIHFLGQEGAIDPFDPECVNPASYDLKLGNSYRAPAGPDEWSEPIEFDELIIQPGGIVLCHSLEYTRLPETVCAKLFLKSSTGRKGLEHLHAGYGDPGFSGQWTFEVINHWPYPRVLKPGERLFQLTFESMAFAPEVHYGMKRDSHYVGQCGPTPHWDCEGEKGEVEK